MTWFEQLDEHRDKLTDGWKIASGPEFWAAHLLAQGFDEDEDVIFDAFKVKEPAVNKVLDRLTGPDTWPVFTVGLPGGARLHVVYRNYDDDEGVDYLFDAGGGLDDAVRIAGLEGDFAGPGASLAELAGFAGRDEVLLLAPMCGEADASRDAIRHLTAATGSRELTDLLIEDHPMWDAPAWRRDGDLLVCDGEDSPRNPRSVTALPRRALEEITAAFR